MGQFFSTFCPQVNWEVPSSLCLSCNNYHSSVFGVSIGSKEQVSLDGWNINYWSLTITLLMSIFEIILSLIDHLKANSTGPWKSWISATSSISCLWYIQEVDNQQARTQESWFVMWGMYGNRCPACTTCLIRSRRYVQLGIWATEFSTSHFEKSVRRFINNITRRSARLVNGKSHR